MLLLGQIFIIICLQGITENFISDDNKNLKKTLNTACYLGMLYFVLQFVVSNLLPEITKVITVF
jgi:hypothetical protein